MRLFVAIDFPDAVREAIRGLIAQLKPESRSARWVRPEGMHITLKFLGETDPSRLGSIRSALSAIQSSQPVEMRFRALGFFPNERRPRVLWIGVEASPILAALAADADRALASIGFAPESRAFVPHLTLARFQSPKGTESLVRKAGELKDAEFGSTRESQFYLFQSILKPSGAEYRRLETFAFVRGAA
ncbi:MAG TPA: RNA 2',3'-cyclic phosphodiesterase [Candidatus Acidoferrales bacterium]|nr:RNA 2',3'-cyclic phosphodiesterase [Candidatus Acidoferrales bacterium]